MGLEVDQSSDGEGNSSEWAKREFGLVDLGDVRRTRRLVSAVAKMVDQPGCSIPQLAQSWSECKAFYRLLDREELSAEVILDAHREGTLHRASHSGEGVVLAVQDTTSLNFSTREKLAGQGPIGNSDKTTGLHLHNTLLLGGDSGKVFGLVGAKIYARDGAKRRSQRPGTRNRETLEEKESYRWVESFELARQCRQRLHAMEAAGREGPLVLSVGDREADIYELLREAQQHREEGVGLLVRSQHNRKVCENSERLWDRLAQCEAAGKVVITVPRSRGMKQREAELTLRYQSVELEVPAHKAKYLNLKESIRITVLELKEEGARGLAWRLLTTEEVRDLAKAKQVAGWYAKRWQIEVLHRVLKTGCRVEDRQMREMKRLKPMIALDLVAACYLMGMASEARVNPNASATEWLDDQELGALEAYWRAKGEQAPDSPTTIGQAVRWISSLGGHLGRTSDGSPGAEVLWRGLQQLRTLTIAWRLFSNSETSG